ncbi:Putative folylpolyglutamate synthetase, Mur ligase, Mur ligase, central [Colletotrichum destructivum]|uniref:tetrahydrofolate synthase n=1 Tax=Colletotrichum destructivum TaxID=34406 RepID=A0AAX4J1U3_9PEZI|nr:Putative folylpolyglutamate synthetase, Mur ligase, Mur ligase, central [Colletotrichum destructivum]
MREEKTYQRAVELLRSRRMQRSAKPPSSTLPIVRLPNGSPSFRGTPHLQGMKEWLEKLGHKEENLNRLNIIHVAGTKGKGSTCAYIDSFLRSHGIRTGFPAKRGLYMSPYLDKHNEMIRINSVPLSDERFTAAFFDVWDGLGLRQEDTGTPKQLQLLALMSFHVFLQEGVDVAVYETHHGGKYDVTNVIQHPVVTVITTIGLDHQMELGGTIENIAWHKSGIFKAGAYALSAPQVPDAAEVLKEVARGLHLQLKFVDTSLGLPGDFQHETQRINASLARDACNAFLVQQDQGGFLTEKDIEAGIQTFRLPGRFQLVKTEKRLTWCLDGAHNPMSATVSASWFSNIPKPKRARSVLLFGIDSDRHNPHETLKSLGEVLGNSITCVILTSNTGIFDRERLEGYAKVWGELSSRRVIIAERDDGVEQARCEEGSYILVTGSLFLVAYVLKKLKQPHV